MYGAIAERHKGRKEKHNNYKSDQAGRITLVLIRPTINMTRSFYNYVVFLCVLCVSAVRFYFYGSSPD